MQQAAKVLIGEHDFTSFRSSQCQAKSPVRTMTRLNVVRSGDIIVFTLQANAFLHHMVRNIIGTLLQVGIGKKSVEWVQEVLQQRDRSLAAPTFSADGLYLAKVSYPEHFQIPLPNFGQSAIPEKILNQSFQGRVMS
jgi:tRNA pseudouridine38-40 synthase